MADIPIYGLDKELAEKAKAKYDPALEQSAQAWLGEVLGKPVSGAFHDALKDGVVLCQVLNRIDPTLNLKANTSKIAFMQMENIGRFLGALDRFGVPKADQFQTVDLYEAKNLGQVVTCLFSLSRHAAAKGFACPPLGPKLADKHVVTFTPEQLAEGQNIISLQYGSASGANQSGMSYGASRQITDSKVGLGATDVVSQQSGYNGGANASGISYGNRRDIGGQDPGRIAK